MQTTKISQLSDGQQSRIVFAMICLKKPNLLLLDEPVRKGRKGRKGARKLEPLGALLGSW